MASSFPSSGAPARPVLSRKHFPQARNTVDHLRGDRKDELKRVASLSKMGRFHAETPRGFASSKAPQPKQAESRIRTTVPRPVDHVQRLIHGCAPTTTGPAAAAAPAPLRRSASYTTSRDHPFSPVRHAEAKSFEDAAISRTSSRASLSKTASQRFWEANEPVSHRGVRTFNSGLETARVLQPSKQEATPRPTYRSESPTFVRSATDTNGASSARSHSGIRTTIPAFTPQELPRRPVTPTRRHPYPGGLRPSHVFATNTVEDNKVSIERVRAASRRAATPTPPPRGRSELSLVDSPAVETPLCRRRAATPTLSRYDGTLPPADSVRRSASRNQSSIVFDWK